MHRLGSERTAEPAVGGAQRDRQSHEASASGRHRAVPLGRGDDRRARARRCKGAGPQPGGRAVLPTRPVRGDGHGHGGEPIGRDADQGLRRARRRGRVRHGHRAARAWLGQDRAAAGDARAQPELAEAGAFQIVPRVARLLRQPPRLLCAPARAVLLRPRSLRARAVRVRAGRLGSGLRARDAARIGRRRRPAAPTQGRRITAVSAASTAVTAAASTAVTAAASTAASAAASTAVTAVSTAASRRLHLRLRAPVGARLRRDRAGVVAGRHGRDGLLGRVALRRPSPARRREHWREPRHRPGGPHSMPRLKVAVLAAPRLATTGSSGCI